MKFFMRKRVIFSSIALLIPITVFGWGVELPLSVTRLSHKKLA
jgi:hypothetical protein